MKTTSPDPAERGITARNLANYDSAASVTAYTREEGLRPLEAELVDSLFPPPPATVLDLGCGAGRTTWGLAQKGFEVIAIDLSQGLLGEARRRYPDLDFREMDATRLAFLDASFDAAMFSYNGIDCIYPVEQRERCMTEVYRILRPGGVFLFSSHNWLGAVWSGGYFYPQGYANAWKNLKEQRGNRLLREGYWLYRDDGGDQHLYSATPGHTVRQLRRAGFTGIEVIGYRRGMSRGEAVRRSQHVHFAARKPAGRGEG
jgi:SAM-dependent methyltransferase